MKNKLLEKIRNRVAYSEIKKIATSCEFDDFHKRHIVDLENGYLFYFPITGKVLTTRKGLVFKKRDGKLECWYTRSELKELINELELTLK